jgi:hypothetical protein
MRLTKRQIEERLLELAADIAISECMDDPPDYYALMEERGELLLDLRNGNYRYEYPAPKHPAC